MIRVGTGVDKVGVVQRQLDAPRKDVIHGLDTQHETNKTQLNIIL